jgi:tetrapyrrole methylase family protein/MazG family protein
LMRAYRISERVAKTGFDWTHISGIFNKLEEELAELKSALADTNRNNTHSRNISAEFGDILFTLVNVARFLNIHPESALKDAIKKFENRFGRLERIVSEKGKKMDALTSEEMERLWNEAKGQLDGSL